MTHLYIEQNGITEEVSSSVISKLYQLASSGTLDGTSNLKGRLHSSIGRDVEIYYLTTHYQDLHISVDALYISFVDPEVERVLINQWGDGSGITEAQINSHNNIGSIFKSNTTITSFDELDRFASVTTISNQAFEGASNLTSIGLSNIQYIGWNAFKGADITGSISMPNIKVIGSISESGAGNRGQAFAGNKHITSVSCGSYLTHLFDYSFTNCTSLQTVTGLDNLQTIGPSVFSGCSALTSVTGLSNITSIPAAMFQNCASLTDVDIDWTKITSIDSYAFSNCTSLNITSLSIPNLTNLGRNAFYGVPIQSIKNLGSITSFGICAFQGNTALTSVVLPNTLTTIAQTAFGDCTNLATINIPSSVTEIGSQAFDNCPNLDCTFDLSSITISGQAVFRDCKKLKITALPKISQYPSQGFRGMTSLTSITIPKEVITTGASSFSNCSNLQNVTFESNSQLETLSDGTFQSCDNLSQIVIPEGCTHIGQGCFRNCGNLMLLDIPSTVTYVGGVFAYIQNSANRTNMTVIFRCNLPTFEWTTDPFNKNTSYIQIYVPDDQVTAYKSAAPFSKYTNNIFGISELPSS